MWLIGSASPASMKHVLSWTVHTSMFYCTTLTGKFCIVNTVKPILKDHCHERPPVLKDQIFLAQRTAFHCSWTCHQRPPILRDHILMAHGVVFQDRFYCICFFVFFLEIKVLVECLTGPELISQPYHTFAIVSMPSSPPPAACSPVSGHWPPLTSLSSRQLLTEKAATFVL